MAKSYVAQKRNKPPAIGMANHRVVLCTMKDIVDEQGQMRLAREAAMPVWAWVREKRGQLFDRDGRPVKEQREQASHEITIRICGGIEISATAWVYEHRSTLSPRWFKVLDTQEIEEVGSTGRFWRMSCRLVERSDEASKPALAADAAPSLKVAVDLPEGVSL